MGKASSSKRRRSGAGGAGATPRRQHRVLANRYHDSAAAVSAALGPGEVSLAAMLQRGIEHVLRCIEEDSPEEYLTRFDLLDIMWAGAAAPARFEDESLFANLRRMWVDRLAETLPEAWLALGRAAAEVHARGGAVDDPEFFFEVFFAAALDPLLLAPVPDALASGVLLAEWREQEERSERMRVAFPADAAARAEAFLAHTGAALDDDSVAAALLRGLARLEPDEHAAIVVGAALYVGFCDPRAERLSADRLTAWLAGLPAGSAPWAAANVVAYGVANEWGLSTTLCAVLDSGRAFEPVPPEVCGYRSSVGVDAVKLLMAQGMRRVRFGERDQVLLDPVDSALFGAQVAFFEETFGRPASGADPIFFDPSADAPRHVASERIADAFAVGLRGVGASEAFVTAWRVTGRLPKASGRDATTPERLEFANAYLDAGGTEETLSLDLERLSMLMLVERLSIALEHPRVGQAMVKVLEDGSDPEAASALSRWCPSSFGAPEVAERARAIARTWAGQALAVRVDEAASAVAQGEPCEDQAALLCLCAARLQTPA